MPTPEAEHGQQAREIEDTQKEALQNRRMLSHRFFSGYVYHLVTHAPLYSHWQRLLALLRRFRTVAFLWRILTVTVTVIETGALVILTTAIFLVILPISTALMLGVLLTARIESRRTNRQMRDRLREKSVYVLFLAATDNGFLWQNAKDLAASGKAVIVVSPFWISPKGMKKGHFYFTLRREAPNVYLIRRYYFFSLRKHVLKDATVAYLF